MKNIYIGFFCNKQNREEVTAVQMSRSRSYSSYSSSDEDEEMNLVTSETEEKEEHKDEDDPDTFIRIKRIISNDGAEDTKTIIDNEQMDVDTDLSEKCNTQSSFGKNESNLKGNHQDSNLNKIRPRHQ